MATMNDIKSKLVRRVPSKKTHTVPMSELCALLRYYVLSATSQAGSGHPTSCLSSVELMAELFFDGFFRYDIRDPHYHNNDRIIFSKGHAAPLLYSLWTVAGVLSEDELIKMRTFDSPLEGHPSMRFPFNEAATGSLGQGLGLGLGMALNAQYLDHLPYQTYVLLGDSELSEGSVWEAVQIASYYRLNQLTAIVDINGYGQQTEPMLGHDVEAYARRFEAFGWNTIVVDGHDLRAIQKAYGKAKSEKHVPSVILASTVKGKGISFLEADIHMHAKTLSTTDLQKALQELDIHDTSTTTEIEKPLSQKMKQSEVHKDRAGFLLSSPLATRKVYGAGLASIAHSDSRIVALDAELSNSTFSADFKEQFPKRFFEMFIAEQNMVSVACGLSRVGKKPCISTYGAFFTRAHDQIRMAAYSEADIALVGSHNGVSVGPDGVSQMGLDDIAMMRGIYDSVVLYPSDAVSAYACLQLAVDFKGISYVRMSRPDVETIYDKKEAFCIGGSKILRASGKAKVAVIAVGITVHHALAACDLLKKEGIEILVVDAYSIKPLDTDTLAQLASLVDAYITVEDHYAQGGLGEAVASELSELGIPIYRMAVTKLPRSGTPEELFEYEEISAEAIVRKVKSLSV